MPRSPSEDTSKFAIDLASDPSIQPTASAAYPLGFFGRSTAEKNPPACSRKTPLRTSRAQPMRPPPIVIQHSPGRSLALLEAFCTSKSISQFELPKPRTEGPQRPGQVGKPRFFLLERNRPAGSGSTRDKGRPFRFELLPQEITDGGLLESFRVCGGGKFQFFGSPRGLVYLGDHREFGLLFPRHQHRQWSG